MTSEELIRTGHIWKNIHGSWSRFCPQCKSVIDYIGISDRRMKDACRKAHIKQCVCAKCRTANKVGVELKPPPTGVWKSERNNWCRTCLKCCETVIHKGKKAKSKCILAFNAQRLCKVCSITRTKELPEGIWDDNECWCRKCPKCNQIIKYPHDKWAKYTCIKGLGKLCKVCSGVESSKKQIGQKRSSQWCKNIGNSKRGPKNPWFGKKRSPEFCKIVSEANKGKKNPWWGKTRPSDLVHRTMLAIEKSKYKRKEYTFPDGHKSLVQGYEPQTLDCLIAEGINNIIVKAADMPMIMYEWEGKTKRYYPDALINGTMVVEVKSTYTWKFAEERNKAKLRATVMQGYDVVLFIWKNHKELLTRITFIKDREPVFPIID